MQQVRCNEGGSEVSLDALGQESLEELILTAVRIRNEDQRLWFGESDDATMTLASSLPQPPRLSRHIKHVRRDDDVHWSVKPNAAQHFTLPTLAPAQLGYLQGRRGWVISHPALHVVAQREGSVWAGGLATRGADPAACARWRVVRSARMVSRATAAACVACVAHQRSRGTRVLCIGYSGS